MAIIHDSKLFENADVALLPIISWVQDAIADEVWEWFYANKKMTVFKWLFVKVKVKDIKFIFEILFGDPND